FRYSHKMSGFLRFRELEDKTLYAQIDGKFNILCFLGKHFSKRLNNQNYIIHDLKRSLAFIHTKEFVGIKEVADFHMPKSSDDEAKFQKLWQEFFDSVAIKSRMNERLQKSMVPLIYRTYMNEFWSV
ncbi:MAG: TIGR03915 family putative DNA repair protein, partial [Epsilonproteobacteria bacterium]|nr:TIGR03915 family putative DNA repair protein [Campylobacterota bacterium]